MTLGAFNKKSCEKGSGIIGIKKKRRGAGGGRRTLLTNSAVELLINRLCSGIDLLRRLSSTAV